MSTTASEGVCLFCGQLRAQHDAVLGECTALLGQTGAPLSQLEGRALYMCPNTECGMRAMLHLPLRYWGAMTIPCVGCQSAMTYVPPKDQHEDEPPKTMH